MSNTIGHWFSWAKSKVVGNASEANRSVAPGRQGSFKGRSVYILSSETSTGRWKRASKLFKQGDQMKSRAARNSLFHRAHDNIRAAPGLPSASKLFAQKKAKLAAEEKENKNTGGSLDELRTAVKDLKSMVVEQAEQTVDWAGRNVKRMKIQNELASIKENRKHIAWSDEPFRRLCMELRFIKLQIKDVVKNKL